MKKIIYAFALILAFTSCLKHKSVKPKEVVVDTSAFPCGDTVYFNAELMNEIFLPNCISSGCHDQNHSLGYDFNQYSIIHDIADTILKAIKHENGYTPMPLGANQLNDSLINKFDCWIQQGRMNN